MTQKYKNQLQNIMNYLKQLQDLGIVLKRQSGSTKTKCPKCSHTRRNKTDDCLSVNIDEGLQDLDDGDGMAEDEEDQDGLFVVFEL